MAVVPSFETGVHETPPHRVKETAEARVAELEALLGGKRG